MKVQDAFNRLGNPLLSALLRSPLHALAGSGTALISVTGRRSRRTYATPVNVIADGNQLTIVSLRERTWWRNLRQGAEVGFAPGRPGFPGPGGGCGRTKQAWPHFIISLVNVNGDVIGWEQRFLTLRYTNPDFSAPKNLDNQANETLLREQLDFQGLQIDALTVTAGAGSEQDVQTVSIRLTASSLQAANAAIPGLIGTLISHLSKINRDSDVVLIAVCRLWITDTQRRYPAQLFV